MRTSTNINAMTTSSAQLVVCLIWLTIGLNACTTATPTQQTKDLRSPLEEAIQERVGKTYWLTGGLEDGITPFPPSNEKSFQIMRVYPCGKSTCYGVRMDSGRDAHVDAIRFMDHHYFDSASARDKSATGRAKEIAAAEKILTTETLQAREEEQWKAELERELEARRVKLLAALKKTGVVPGTPLWSRQAWDEVQATQRVIFFGVVYNTNSLAEVDAGNVFIKVTLANGETTDRLLGTYKHVINDPKMTIDAGFMRKLSWPQRIVKAIQAKQVVIGMTGEQLIASWGGPNQINSTEGKWGKSEQWVYGSNIGRQTYIYLENDHVTAWQN